MAVQAHLGEPGREPGSLSLSPDLAPYLTSEARDWLVLLKPRVVSLVVFTAAIAMMLAPGSINPVIAVAAVLCVAVAAGASGAINMWYDRDIDALMRRTAKRPIPAGRIGPDAALGYGVCLAIASVLLMYLATNLVAAVLLAASILFYVLVYTMWLKRRTPQNIVIGGAAGAFPPLIGWAAVTGDVAVLPFLMFAIVFLWTPPHFWALSLYASGDYARAGVPMLPVVSGARSTRWHVLAYTVLLVLASLSPWMLGLAGPLYAVAATVLGVGFLAGAVKALLEPQDQAGRSLVGDAAARQTFRFSLAYLFVLFLALAVDHVVR